MGILAFWISWPALWVYLQRGERTRLLLVCNGEFLVLRSWLRSGRRWNLPGGGLHNHEKPAEGLIREVMEETGITLTKQQITHMYKGEYKESGLRFAYDCYVCELPRKPLVTPQKGEITDYAWQPVNAPALTLSHDVQTALSWWLSKG